MANPVVLNAVNDESLKSARILAFIWEGATSQADTVTVRHRPSVPDVPGDILWVGRTNVTNTYQGLNLSPKGLHAPNGFILTQRSSGRVLVYLMED